MTSGNLVAIEMNPELGLAYNIRGISHMQIKCLVGVCEDLRRALDLGYEMFTR